MKYKVLSLLQPWASLVVMGHKKIETRSRNTKYRGPLLIHASMGTKKSILAMLAQEPFKTVLKELAHPHNVIETKWDIPRGEIIGSVNLEDTYQFKGEPYPQYGNSKYATSLNDWYYVDVKDDNPIAKLELTPEEKAFGHYSKNRWGWLLKKPVKFEHTIPVKGNLGIWNWECELPII